MGELTLTMIGCSNEGCLENFFVESEKVPTQCAFCGEETVYPTYTYQAKPDSEELLEFSSENLYEDYQK